MISSPRQSGRRSGRLGAAATAHPLATDAAVAALREGGSAVDAAIAAQAVICVVMPQAAGLGGDVLALVRDADGVAAVNGSGCSPRGMVAAPLPTGAASVTVPGLVDGWLTLHERWGRLPLGTVLQAAVDRARHGSPLDPQLLAALAAQRGRLLDGGAAGWTLLSAADRHADRWEQPLLAELLGEVAEQGRAAFYTGPVAHALVDAVRRGGGALAPADLSEHSTPCPPPVTVPWGDGLVHVQPPMSQGVLLAMALQEVRRLRDAGVHPEDHLLVEVTQAVFEHRAACARGADLLAEPLRVDLERASGRTGPRAYLHTAGVATVDADGCVVASLVSVFDDFGSGVFVPELGIVLNNRAAGFTDGANAARPGHRPVHTLAPAMLTVGEHALGIATPGADGQVQTLLQVLAGLEAGAPLEAAVSALRWRTQEGELLLEEGHPARDELQERGHRIRPTAPGADLFGAVVAAGSGPNPYAVSDWRRQTTSRGAA